MSAEIIDGGRDAEELIEEAECLRSLSINPGLATVAVVLTELDRLYADAATRGILALRPVTRPNGTARMVGDVDFGSVVGPARAVTPVPGGVGPPTDLWLLANVLADAAGWHANVNRTRALAAGGHALASGAGW